uniref:Transposable element P transposase-like RNase H domain-containing protein n=1 Tax=Daphnia galeata TaxID=27404 RepID=A0A8J2R9X0_9CRUS|nr:unnamed protein product [Daphnia galeata]
MVWPPQSPDLNPIEAIWDYVDVRLKKSIRTSKEHMWNNIQYVWNNIPKKTENSETKDCENYRLLKSALETISDMESDIEKLKASSFTETIKHLSPQVIVREFINKGKAVLKGKSTRAHGMRYDDAFVMQCLLLKMKSNRAYRYILEEGMLALPSVSTIRRVLSSSDCVFGFNSLALESIKKALHGLPVAERWGSLMWDEIKIKKDLTWNSKNLEWHGVVDFGRELKSKIQDGIADHALVFMFRPYKHSWIQPIACFATKGAASGKVLFELILCERWCPDLATTTTLRGMRIVIHSAMQLTKDMLDNGYSYVLPGKWNQDPVERFFGIVRSIDDCPTAHSWLHIFRILSLYNPCKNAVCIGNVDNEDKLSVLVAYKKCLVNKFKESEDSAREVCNGVSGKTNRFHQTVFDL